MPEAPEPRRICAGVIDERLEGPVVLHLVRPGVTGRALAGKAAKD